MAKQRRYTYSVSGFGLFPFDMLRYDSCHPAHESETPLMGYCRVCDGKETIPRMIHLRSNQPPTPERWKSFGWVVRDTTESAV